MHPYLKYLKGCCTIAAFFIFGLINGQTTTPLKAELLNIISYSTPGFQYSSDSAFNAQLLAKYYSIPNYLYNTGYKDSLSKKETIFLDSLLAYTAKRYVADVAMQRKNNITVSEQEALAYYNANKNLYAVRGQATYLLAVLIKDEPIVAEAAKKKMLQLADIPDSLIAAKDLRNADYGISIEKNVPLNDNIALLRIISSMKAKQVSDPVQIDGYNSKCIIYVRDKTDTGYRPYLEVKEDCRNRVKAEKTEAMLQQLIKEAVAAYPPPAK